MSLLRTLSFRLSGALAAAKVRVTDKPAVAALEKERHYLWCVHDQVAGELKAGLQQNSGEWHSNSLNAWAWLEIKHCGQIRGIGDYMTGTVKKAKSKSVNVSVETLRMRIPCILLLIFSNYTFFS